MASASAASSARPCSRSFDRRNMSRASSRAWRSASRSCELEAAGSERSTTRRTSSGALAPSALRVAWMEKRTQIAASPAAFAWWARSGRLSGAGSPVIRRSTMLPWMARRRAGVSAAAANSRTWSWEKP